jgi:ATP-dependent RNA helicase DDX3X
MSYVPPFRRDYQDPNAGVFQGHGYPQQGTYQTPQSGFHQQSNFGGQTHHDHHGHFQQVRPQHNFERAHHGDRRAGPHTGGFVREHTFNVAAAPYVPYTRDEKPEEDIFKEHTPGINFDQYESITVTVTPNDVPAVETFEAMNLVPIMFENIQRCNYTKPTPVQKHSIPIVLNGRDIMACAQTGSGKTAAYLLPAVNYMLVKAYHLAAPQRTAAPTALIMAPTRELSVQIYEEGRKFTFRTGLRCVVVYGGADPRYQITELTRGCNLLVATPGRLWDMFSRGYVRFSDIRFMVLDEADRMLDMGFEPQIRQIVQGPETDMPAPGERQTLMYSATFPREIQQLAREFLCSHYFLQVGRVGSTTENITQEVRWLEDADKRDALYQIIQANEGRLTLVFVEKKRDADYLERILRSYRVYCTSIHGDRVQREREEALNLFKNGHCTVLVATDVASRGLDIPNVSVVVQYDLPSNIDDYVHRIGRTGRAGKTGQAIAFFNEKNRNIVDDLVPLLKETSQEVPQWLDAMVTKRPMQSSNYRGRGFGGFRGGNRGGFGRGGGGGGFRGAAGGFGGAPHFGHGGHQRQLFQPGTR